MKKGGKDGGGNGWRRIQRLLLRAKPALLACGAVMILLSLWVFNSGEGPSVKTKTRFGVNGEKKDATDVAGNTKLEAKDAAVEGGQLGPSKNMTTTESGEDKTKSGHRQLNKRQEPMSMNLTNHLNQGAKANASLIEEKPSPPETTKDPQTKDGATIAMHSSGITSQTTVPRDHMDINTRKPHPDFAKHQETTTPHENGTADTMNSTKEEIDDPIKSNKLLGLNRSLDAAGEQLEALVANKTYEESRNTQNTRRRKKRATDARVFQAERNIESAKKEAKKAEEMIKQANQLKEVATRRLDRAERNRHQALKSLEAAKQKWMEENRRLGTHFENNLRNLEEERNQTEGKIKALEEMRHEHHQQANNLTSVLLETKAALRNITVFLKKTSGTSGINTKINVQLPEDLKVPLENTMFNNRKNKLEQQLRNIKQKAEAISATAHNYGVEPIDSVENIKHVPSLEKFDHEKANIEFWSKELNDVKASWDKSYQKTSGDLDQIISSLRENEAAISRFGFPPIINVSLYLAEIRAGYETAWRICRESNVKTTAINQRASKIKEKMSLFDNSVNKLFPKNNKHLKTLDGLIGNFSSSNNFVGNFISGVKGIQDNITDLKTWAKNKQCVTTTTTVTTSTTTMPETTPTETTIPTTEAKTTAGTTETEATTQTTELNTTPEIKNPATTNELETSEVTTKNIDSSATTPDAQAIEASTTEGAVDTTKETSQQSVSDNPTSVETRPANDTKTTVESRPPPPMPKDESSTTTKRPVAMKTTVPSILAAMTSSEVPVPMDTTLASTYSAGSSSEGSDEGKPESEITTGKSEVESTTSKPGNKSPEAASPETLASTSSPAGSDDNSTPLENSLLKAAKTSTTTKSTVKDPFTAANEIIQASSIPPKAEDIRTNGETTSTIQTTSLTLTTTKLLTTGLPSTKSIQALTTESSPAKVGPKTTKAESRQKTTTVKEPKPTAKTTKATDKPSPPDAVKSSTKASVSAGQPIAEKTTAKTEPPKRPIVDNKKPVKKTTTRTLKTKHPTTKKPKATTKTKSPSDIDKKFPEPKKPIQPPVQPSTTLPKVILPEPSSDKKPSVKPETTPVGVGKPPTKPEEGSDKSAELKIEGTAKNGTEKQASSTGKDKEHNGARNKRSAKDDRKSAGETSLKNPLQIDTEVDKEGAIDQRPPLNLCASPQYYNISQVAEIIFETFASLVEPRVTKQTHALKTFLENKPEEQIQLLKQAASNAFDHYDKIQNAITEKLSETKRLLGTYGETCTNYTDTINRTQLVLKQERDLIGKIAKKTNDINRTASDIQSVTKKLELHKNWESRTDAKDLGNLTIDSGTKSAFTNLRNAHDTIYSATQALSTAEENLKKAESKITLGLDAKRKALIALKKAETERNVALEEIKAGENKIIIIVACCVVAIIAIIAVIVGVVLYRNRDKPAPVPEKPRKPAPRVRVRETTSLSETPSQANQDFTTVDGGSLAPKVMGSLWGEENPGEEVPEGAKVSFDTNVTCVRIAREDAARFPRTMTPAGTAVFEDKKQSTPEYIAYQEAVREIRR